MAGEILTSRISLRRSAAGITTAQRDALIAAVPAAPESPPWKETPARLGWDAWFFAGADFKKFLNEDVKRIGAIIGSLELKK